MPTSFVRTIPILRIFDVAKTCEFYVDYLGSFVDFEHRFHENVPPFMQVSRADLILRLSEHYGDGSPGVHVRIETTGVEDHVERSASRALAKS
jgi:hypothetical protein